MPSSRLQQACLVLLLLTTLASAIPEVAFPINSQLPPVAYVSQLFEFTFASNTFTSSVSEVSYSLTNQPAWLSLDAHSRRLTGTPASRDIGAKEFGIIASDVSGHTSASVTFVVLQEKALYPNSEALPLQLGQSAQVSAPSTLLLHPQRDFAFTLQPNLFNGVSTTTVFYAVSADGSPLPSWLQFDAKSLRFSGTTPPLLNPVQTQQISRFNLTASDVVGFSEASIQFDISISDHVIAFAMPSISFSGSTGSPLRINSLLEQITVDGSRAQRDQILSVDSNAPSWLYLNTSDLSFNGTVPKDSTTLMFWLSVRGINANSANATITVQISDRQSTSLLSLGNVTAVAGSYFSYRIVPPAGLGANIRTTVNSSDLPSWLTFVTSNLTIQGFVPLDVEGKVRTIRFTFSNGLQTVTSNLTLVTSKRSGTTTDAGIQSSSTSGVDRSQTSTATTNHNESSDRHALTIVLATVLPTIAVLLFLIVLCFLARRRKRQNQETLKPAAVEHSKRPPTQGTTTATTLPKPTNGTTALPEVAQKEGNEVPQVGLSYAPGTLAQTTRRLSQTPRISRISTIGSNWEDLIIPNRQSTLHVSRTASDASKSRHDSVRPSSLKAPASGPIPQRPARPDSLPDVLSGPKYRNSITLQGRGLPHQLGAAGHGAGSSQGRLQAGSRSSWQTTMGTLPIDERRPSNIIMSSFPRPPSQELTESDTNLKENPSQSMLGLVESRSSSSGSLQDARQNYYTSRARDRLEGRVRFSQARAKRRSPNIFADIIPESPSESLVDELSTIDRRNRAPPLPRKSQARRRVDRLQTLRNNDPSSHRLSSINRESSIASSHQFDSAVSSDSQWEDEENTGVLKAEDYQGQSSSSMPPEYSSSRHAESSSKPKRVSFDESGPVGNRQTSGHGSIRFI